MATAAQTTATFETLPNEVFYEIFEYISFDDIKNLRVASAHLHGPVNSIIFRTIFLGEKDLAAKANRIVRHPDLRQQVKVIKFEIDGVYRMGLAGAQPRDMNLENLFKVCDNRVKPGRSQDIYQTSSEANATDALRSKAKQAKSEVLTVQENKNKNSEIRIRRVNGLSIRSLDGRRAVPVQVTGMPPRDCSNLYTSKLTLLAPDDVKDPSTNNLLSQVSAPQRSKRLRELQWTALQPHCESWTGLYKFFLRCTIWRPSIKEVKVLEIAFKNCSGLEKIVYDVSDDVKYRDECEGTMAAYLTDRDMIVDIHFQPIRFKRPSGGS